MILGHPEEQFWDRPKRETPSSRAGAVSFRQGRALQLQLISPFLRAANNRSLDLSSLRKRGSERRSG